MPVFGARSSAPRAYACPRCRAPTPETPSLTRRRVMAALAGALNSPSPVASGARSPRSGPSQIPGTSSSMSTLDGASEHGRRGCADADRHPITATTSRRRSMPSRKRLTSRARLAAPSTQSSVPSSLRLIRTRSRSEPRPCVRSGTSSPPTRPSSTSCVDATRSLVRSGADFSLSCRSTFGERSRTASVTCRRQSGTSPSSSSGSISSCSPVWLRSTFRALLSASTCVPAIALNP